MNTKYEVRKRLAILGWVMVSTLLFWVISFLPNSFEIGSFLNYLILLFGGGFAFHFLTELISAPANESNWDQWGTLVISLSKAAFIILSVFGIAYFEKYIYSTGGFLTILSTFPAIWLLISQAEKAHDILNNIKNN